MASIDFHGVNPNERDYVKEPLTFDELDECWQQKSFPGFGGDYSSLFVGAGKRTLERSQPSRLQDPIECYRYDDPTVETFIQEVEAQVAEKASERGRYSKEHFGIIGGWPENVNKMRTAAGVGMVPHDLPQLTSATKRSELGLKNTDPVAVENYRRIMQLRYSEYVGDYCPYSVRGGSSSSAPFRAYDKESKMRIAWVGLQYEKEIIDLALAGKFEELMRRYGVVFLATVGKRLQQESAEKERMVFSPWEILGVSGDMPYPRYADKHLSNRALEAYGKPVAVKLHAARERGVIAIPTVLNALLAKNLEPYLAVHAARTKGLYKWSTVDHRVAMFNQGFSILRDPDALHTDVTTMDATTPPEYIAAQREVEAKVFGDRFVEFKAMIEGCARLFRTPENLVERYGKHMLVGNPFNKEWLLNHTTVQASGSYLTSIDNKDRAFADLLTAVRYADGCKEPVTLDELVAIMNGASMRPSGVFHHAVIFGDDIEQVGDSSFLKDVADILSDGVGFKHEASNSPFQGGYAIIPETPVASTNWHGVKFNAVENPETFINKIFAPEFGYEHPHAENLMLGLKSKLLYYTRHPEVHEFIKMIDDIHVRTRGFSFIDWINQSVLPVVSNYDAEFLLDPSVVSWKFDASLVDPALLNQHLASFDLLQFQRVVPLIGEPYSYFNLPYKGIEYAKN